MFNVINDSSSVTLFANDTSSLKPIAWHDRYDTETALYEVFRPARVYVEKVFPPIWYILGFTGNILAFAVWVQRKMRHSSGCYLAALALADIYFLFCHMLYEIHYIWSRKILDHPIVCESFTMFYMASQYLSPILVLAFTVERFISICHPFQRERYCSTRLAVRVIVCVFIFVLALAGIQAYFFTYHEDTGICDIRSEEASDSNVEDLWNVWSWITEMLIFAVVPFTTLFFNIMVIRETRKISRADLPHAQGSNGHKHSTTVMLMSVSFYYIVTTLPVTVAYSLYPQFDMGDKNLTQSEMETDPKWQKHFDYVMVRTVIHVLLGLSHYALNFYIYLLTGKLFRKTLIDLFKSTVPVNFRRRLSTLEKSSLMTYRTSLNNGRHSLKPNHDHVENRDQQNEHTHTDPDHNDNHCTEDLC